MSKSLSAYARQFLDMMGKPDVDHISGLSPGDFHRAEDHLEEPALHRRHGDRDLRLPAPAVRPRRHALFARDRPADHRDAGAGHGRCRHGDAGGHARLSAGPDRPRPQGRVPQGIPRPAQAGLPAGQGRTARSTSWKTRRRWTRSSATTSTWWWTGSWCAKGIETRLADSFRTALNLADGIAVLETAPARGRGRARPHHLFREIRLPGLRLHHRRDRAAPVLLQRALRRLPGLRRAGGGAVLRRTPGRARPGPDPDAGRHRALGQVEIALLHRRRSRRCPSTTASTRRPSGRTCPTAVQEVFLHGSRRRGDPASAMTRAGASIRSAASSRASSPTWNAATARPTAPGSREEIERYQNNRPCGTCDGYRLKPEALAVKIAGLHVGQVVQMSITEAYAWIGSRARDADRRRRTRSPARS